MYTSCSNASRWVHCLAFVLIGTMTQHVEAQRSNRSGLRLGNVAPVQLLILDDVQTNLMLTEKQKEKATAIHEQFTAERRKMFAEISKESGNRRQKLAAMNKKTLAELETILDVAQRKRLQEILLQVNGATELLKDNIAATIKITDDQKEKLADIDRSNTKIRTESRKKLTGVSASTRSTKTSELHRQGNAKLLEILTAEQKKKFESMQGKKIAIKLQ